MTQPLIRFMNDLYVVHGAFSFTEEEYGQIAEDLDLFSITAQVYHMLKEKGRLGELPLFLQDHLKRKAEATLFQNLLVKHETDSVLRMFEANQVDVFIMKGVYFSEKYYGNVGARGTTDIDLLVKPDQVARAIPVIREAGFEIFERNNTAHHALYKRKNQNGVAIYIELHWCLSAEDNERIDYESIWNRSECLSNFSHIKVMAYEDTLYAICLHGINHQMKSLRYFLDIIQLVQSHPNRIDWNGLLERARFERTLNRIRMALYLVRQLFPSVMLPDPHWKRTYPWDYEGARAYLKGVKNAAYYKDLIVFPVLTHMNILSTVYWLGRKMIPPVERSVFQAEEGRRQSIFFVYGKLYRQKLDIIRGFVKKQLK